MDATIANSINRRVAKLVTAYMDQQDAWLVRKGLTPWHNSPVADTLMGDNDATSGDRAWLVGMFAARTPGVDFDGHPADADWDNLFSHFRAEIEARRDPSTQPVCAAQIPALDGVGSR